MSSWPRATSRPVKSAIRRRRRWASGTPRVWMPTSATLSTLKRVWTASQATPWRGRHASGERRPLSSGFVDPHAIKRFAALAVDFSANVQPGQIVAIEAETGMEAIVRAVAERAYERGARFVDPTYFDPYVKKARLQHAPEDTLEFVPEWYGKRMLQLGDVHAARIIFVPRVSPGILNGVDPKRAGRDQLPDIQERLEGINKRLVNWRIMLFPNQSWAELVYPDLDAEAAPAR